MAIDMRNMLAGFSGQLISGTLGELDFSGGVVNVGVDGNPLATCVLRAQDVLDVGFVVTDPPGDDVTVQIGRSGPSFTADGSSVTYDANYFVTYALAEDTAVGTVRRVSDGTLSWTANANTEAERSCDIGTKITCEVSSGSDAGKIVPFVIMRPQGPLDPIA